MAEDEKRRGITEEQQELVVMHLQTEVRAFMHRLEDGYVVQPINRPVPGFRQAGEEFERFRETFSRAQYTEDHLRSIAAWLQEHNSTTPEREGAYDDWLLAAGVYELDVAMLKRVERLVEYLRSRLAQAESRLALGEARMSLGAAAGHMINVHGALNRAIEAADAELARRKKGE